MKINRKQELVTLAIVMIARQGYDSFSFADLAHASGITKASIHHHFPTKKDLVLAVIDVIRDNLQEKMDALQHATADTVLQAMWRKLSECLKAGYICPISSLHAEFNVLPEAVQHHLQAVSVLEEQLTVAVFQKYFEAHSMTPPLPAVAAAQIFLSAMKGAILYARANQSYIASDVVIHTLTLLGIQVDLIPDN